MQLEAAQQELEVPVDRRRWHNERQCDNQQDKRYKRGAMSVSGAMGAGGTGRREVAA